MKGHPNPSCYPSQKGRENPWTRHPCRAHSEGPDPALESSPGRERDNLQMPSPEQSCSLLGAPSRCPTIPRDLVAQVCVIPESCWNAGLDQPENQRPHIVSQRGGRQAVEKKTKFPCPFTHSFMQSIIHFTFTVCLLCATTNHWGHLGDQIKKLPVSRGTTIPVGGGRGEQTTNQPTKRLSSSNKC